MKKGLAKKVYDKINTALRRLDQLPFWWVVFPLIAIVLIPNFVLGKGSVFPFHDQLDESLMNYVLTARHLGEDIIPEMLGGIMTSGMQPAAILFLIFYRFMPPFYAFFCCYVAMMLCGFLGMYLAVKELTESSILAVVSAGLFCMLPLYPIYGLTQMGLPLVLYAYLCLHRRKKRVCSMLLLLLFGLTSHLVCTGYVVLGFWALALLFGLVRGEGKKGLFFWEGGGFLVLLMTYVLVNIRLFTEILFGGGGASHREEMMTAALPFWKTVWDVFQESAQHAPSYHKGFILILFVMLVVEGLVYRWLSRKSRKCFWQAVAGFVILAAIAVFYGICRSAVVVEWKNSVSGFLHYFQAERFYWIYPAGWYLELALVFGVWWLQAQGQPAGLSDTGEKQRRRLPTGGLLVPILVLALTVLPTANVIKENSFFYMNVNQYNNGSGITGYISWESWYSEELMQEIEDAIGRDMSAYRVAHLGISPAPALMHGFYTVDGYSNSYPLEYKHAFRRVIAAELEKAEETAVYFDMWGSRCYLFNSLTGTYWLIPKNSGVKYTGLEFDMEALADLGCEYLFSGGEILDAERMGLKFMGYYETEKSYWGIWLYSLGS